MSNISKLISKVENIKNNKGLDNTDLAILAVVSEKWDEGREVRVTDVTRKLNVGVGSPANVHFRLTKDLVDLKLVALLPNPEDARVKFVVKGKKFDALDKYIGDL
jgi:hypothetical protein